MKPTLPDQRLVQLAWAEVRPSQILKHGDLTMHLGAVAARYRGNILALAPIEFRVLAFFLANPDQVFSRTEIIEGIGKDVSQIEDRTAQVWVRRLRNAINNQGVPNPLRTVRGRGYVLDSVGK